MDTSRSDIPDQGDRYSVDQAQDLTGITFRQVSKWRRRLKEPEKYRKMLYGAAYTKAMAELKVPWASLRPAWVPLAPDLRLGGAEGKGESWRLWAGGP